MFGIGGFELFIILVFGFLIFGPDKLPEIAKTVGKGIARFREAQQEMNDTIGGEKIFDPDNPDAPFKDPVEVLDKIAKRQEEKKAGKTAAVSTTASSQVGSKAASGSAPTAEAPSQVQGSGASQGRDKQESFTERKARYERERAARKAAEAKAAAEGANDAAVAAEAAEAPKAGGASEPLQVAEAGEDCEVPATPAQPASEKGGDA